MRNGTERSNSKRYLEECGGGVLVSAADANDGPPEIEVVLVVPSLYVIDRVLVSRR